MPMAAPLIEDTSQHLLALLPLLHRLVATEVRREVGAAVSVLQLRVLISLLDDAQTLSTLAREHHVSPQALCDVAQNLVERGWLVRTAHPTDRRQHLLTVTESGRAAYIQAREQAMQQITLVLADLSQGELEAIGTALPALHRALARLD